MEPLELFEKTIREKVQIANQFTSIDFSFLQTNSLHETT